MNAPDRQVGGVFVESSGCSLFDARKVLGYIAFGEYR
jgi:hypothetical protein